jgi:oligopeptide transport system substrate-binding protein
MLPSGVARLILPRRRHRMQALPRKGPHMSLPPWTRRAMIAGLGSVAGCGQAVIGLDVARRVLDIGNTGEPLSLDPHKVAGQQENNIIGNLFLGLTTEDQEANPVPGMAERWETSADGLTWTFHLREATWSDGIPCTAHDFVFAYRRMLDPETPAPYASILYPFRNAEAVKKGEKPLSEIGVRAIDDRTLEIGLQHPAPYLPGLLKHYTTFPIPAHVVERHGDAWIKPENVVTNGAYVPVRWWSNYMVQTRKNPRFYDAENVWFEEVNFYPTVDDDAAARRVMKGEIAWNTSFPGKKVDIYERAIPGHPRIHPFLIVYYFSLNCTKPPFDDARVRRALSLTVDREFLCEQIWKAGFIPSYGFVPTGVAGYPNGARLDFADRPMAERREEARALLEAAGYGPDTPLRFPFSHRTTADNPRVAVVVQADWNKIAEWVRVELIGAETQIHYAQLRARDFIAGDGGWIGDYNDARNFLYLLETRTGVQNYPGYSNATYDALMQRADQERDAAARADLMRQAEQLMLDDNPVIPVSIGTSRNLVDPRLTGWTGNLEDIHRARYFGVRG